MNLTEQDLLDNLIATPDDSNQRVQTLIHQNRENKRHQTEAQVINNQDKSVSEPNDMDSKKQDKKDKKDQKEEATAENEEEEKNLPRLKVIKKNKQQNNLKQ